MTIERAIDLPLLSLLRVPISDLPETAESHSSRTVSAHLRLQHPIPSNSLFTRGQACLRFGTTLSYQDQLRTEGYIYILEEHRHPCSFFTATTSFYSSCGIIHALTIVHVCVLYML